MMQQNTGATGKPAGRAKKRKTRRERGSGGLFRRGEIWWIKYSVNGEPVRESAKTRSKERAQQILTDRLDATLKGRIVDSAGRKLKVADLFPAIVRDYEINGRKSIQNIHSVWRHHLKAFFGQMLASALPSEALQQYVAQRIGEGAKNATINRELETLGRMYSLALEADPPKLLSRPKIKKLRERNVRTGFLADDDYHKLAAACARIGTWLRAMLEVGFTFGWREGEVLRLQVRQIDLRERRIFLDPNTTKNEDARVVKFGPRSVLETLLTACCKGKAPTDYVFTRSNGKPVRTFQKIWYTVCCEAAVSHRVCGTCRTELDAKMFCKTCNLVRRVKDSRTVGLLFHDLRRSAARNARNSGVSENIIMKMGGWRTRAMFDRYAIVAEDDMDEAIRRIEARRAQNGHKDHRETRAQPRKTTPDQGK